MLLTNPLELITKTVILNSLVGGYTTPDGALEGNLHACMELIIHILYGYLYCFLTIHEMARLIESDELPQKNRVLTTGVGAVIIIMSA